MSAEKELLLGYLAAQRRHVLGILEGLSHEQLHAAVLPSGWTCLGLLNHLALDVEQFWFERVVAGLPARADDPVTENAWVVEPGTTSAEVLERYRSACTRADEVVAATDLGASPRWWPDFFGDFRMHDLREVILHVLVETAAHAGHLDAARELLDGRQWMVLTD